MFFFSFRNQYNDNFSFTIEGVGGIGTFSLKIFSPWWDSNPDFMLLRADALTTVPWHQGKQSADGRECTIKSF
jgi:hypothetical protein